MSFYYLLPSVIRTYFLKCTGPWNLELGSPHQVPWELKVFYPIVALYKYVVNISYGKLLNSMHHPKDHDHLELLGQTQVVPLSDQQFAGVILVLDQGQTKE